MTQSYFEYCTAVSNFFERYPNLTEARKMLKSLLIHACKKSVLRDSKLKAEFEYLHTELKILIIQTFVQYEANEFHNKEIKRLAMTANGLPNPDLFVDPMEAEAGNTWEYLPRHLEHYEIEKPALALEAFFNYKSNSGWCKIVDLVYQAGISEETKDLIPTENILEEQEYLLKFMEILHVIRMRY
jgi:hypothetical protein